jgi:hypothetical protein
MTIRRSSFLDIVLRSPDSASGVPALRMTKAMERLITRLLTRVIEMRMQQTQGRVNVYLRSSMTGNSPRSGLSHQRSA